MSASQLQKRAIFLVIFLAVVISVLLVLPFFENALREYVLMSFALTFEDGKIVSTDGSTPSMVTTTTLELIFNLFNIAKIVLWMALVIAVVRFLIHLISTTFLRNAAQSEASSLIKTVISIVVYIVAFFIVFQSQYPNVQLAPLFTGSTILGIVVGLALQDTLGNLFAGIALQADQPFQVGDVVSIQNRGSGVVEGISWRGVKIRTFQNKLLVMSNSVMGKETIEVAPRDNLNARLVFFNTLYSNSPSKTIHSVREAVRQVENVSQKIRPIVRVRNLGDNGLDFEIKYWLDDYSSYNDTDALIRQRIWYVFNREGIDFAYPTRTIHIEKKLQDSTEDEILDQTAERLAAISIFSPLSESELEKLSRASSVRVFAPGEAIVRRGQEGKSMFVIRRGSVKVQIMQGVELKTINTLKENDYFGEMSLLTGEPRTATVTAIEETEVLQIRKSAMEPIFENNPELVKPIYDLIEDRRRLLNPATTEIGSAPSAERGKVISTIRKFFGLN